jgi:predicted dehydrogenase
MVEAAKKADKKLYYAEDWLFAPAIIRALEIIEEDAIGEVQFIRAREAHGGSHSPYAQTIEYCGGGCMIHLGIHPIGLALAMKQNKWESLSAVTTGGGENNLRHKKMEGEDWGTCNMTFTDGTVAILEANYLTTGGMEDVISFYGTKGCLHVDIGFSSALKCFSIPGLTYTVEKAEITTGWSSPSVDEKYNLGYIGEIRHFMECVKAGSDARTGLRGIDGYEALKVIEAIYSSARQGTVIKNPAL